MIHHLFDFYSLWLLLPLLAFVVVGIAATENDSPGWVLTFFVVWLAVLTAFSDFRPTTFVTENWLALLIAAPIYLACGVVWAVFRWTLWVRDPDNYATSETKLDPRADRYRGMITAWMSWWPLSAIWWLLRWPRKLVAALYDSLSGVFDRIAENARPSSKK